ncbi:MAG TPA: T9SS type A sorting domain-containing protein, partial [Flavipsychrobacter sp.]
DADPIPANPVANSTQYFLFAQDTVLAVEWGATVPASYTVHQYSGLQAGPMPAGVGRMYFYTAGTPSTWVHGYKPHAYYKDIWLGTIPDESEAVIARSSNGSAWEGYNYSNASTDVANNILAPANTLDSVGSYTGVQNGRIGIRCVENPKGVRITNVTAFVADIEWQPVFNPLGYQVIIKTNNKYPTHAEWAAANQPTTNSLAASGLTEDTKYYVFIRNICGIKDTSGFTMDSFTTLITCHTPVITISGLNDNRAVVSWQDVKTAHKYEYAMNKSATPPAVGTFINKSSMLASFLDDGTQYYVHVRAHCSSMYDKSDWATASFSTWALNVNKLNREGAGMAVYPNPVQEEMVVSIGGVVKEGTIAVLDMTGKLLKTQTINSNTATINAGELPAGMYIVRYTDDSRREQLKFTKQ